MSNLDEFCRKLDKFSNELPELLDAAQLSIMLMIESYIILKSPRFPEAHYATGEYASSHEIKRSGDTLTIRPNTDHDIEVEEGAEGGWWPETSGYQVYTGAAIALKRYVNADLVALAKKLNKHGYIGDLRQYISSPSTVYGRSERNNIDRFGEQS